MSLKTIALAEVVNIPQVNHQIGEDGLFKRTELVAASAKKMLHELARWTKGPKSIKENA